MPARSERLYIVPARNGEACRIMPFPPWWDRIAFLKKYESREIDFDNPIDANYTWLLNAAEAMTWNENCKKRFSSNPGGASEFLNDMLKLESLLKDASWVIVESYEWESGL